MKIIAAFVLALIIVLICHKRIKSYLIGRLGEYRVSKQLKKLNKRKYKVLNNILLKTKRGTVEIDHIVISAKGIYVIETKNRKGIIYGAENWNYWTQKLYTKQHKFYSPIKQNNSHIEALRNILKKHQVKYYSLIVFIKTANIKKVNTMTIIINDDELLTTVKNHKGECYINNHQIKDIINTINKHTVTSLSERNKHKRSVKNKAKIRRKKIKLGICPRCGKKLIKYKSKHGIGLRCIDYPNCKVVIIKSYK